MRALKVLVTGPALILCAMAGRVTSQNAEGKPATTPSQNPSCSALLRFWKATLRVVVSYESYSKSVMVIKLYIKWSWWAWWQDWIKLSWHRIKSPLTCLAILKFCSLAYRKNLRLPSWTWACGSCFAFFWPIQAAGWLALCSHRRSQDINRFFIGHCPVL